MDQKQNIWIVGCGDIGRRVASLYLQDGVKVKGLVCSSASYDLGQKRGIQMLQQNLDDDISLNKVDFQGADVFYFAPPPKLGLVDSRIRHFLGQLEDTPRRVVAISTSGVYGNCEGRWIDESEPLKPVADRAVRRVDAERALQSWSEKYLRDVIILRVPGIYAQDRLPVARLNKGLPVVNEEEAPWTNRIHADDLANICKVVMSRAKTGGIYNVVDNAPGTMTDYFNRVADFCDLPRPPQISLERALNELSAGMASYLKESRRISNDKLLRELDISLQYPDLEAGLSPKS